MKSARTLAVDLIILGLLVWASAGYAQEKGKGGSEAIAQLYAAAKKEGTVVIWGPTDALIYQRMQETLDKQNPGIKIEHFENSQLVKVIASQWRSKGVDISSQPLGYTLIDRDMLVSIRDGKRFALTRSMPISVLSAPIILLCRSPTILRW
jgi:hypothetical protein